MVCKRNTRKNLKNLKNFSLSGYTYVSNRNYVIINISNESEFCNVWGGFLRFFGLAAIRAQ